MLNKCVSLNRLSAVQESLLTLPKHASAEPTGFSTAHSPSAFKPHERVKAQFGSGWEGGMGRRDFPKSPEKRWGAWSGSLLLTPTPRDRAPGRPPSAPLSTGRREGTRTWPTAKAQAQLSSLQPAWPPPLQPPIPGALVAPAQSPVPPPHRPSPAPLPLATSTPGPRLGRARPAALPTSAPPAPSHSATSVACPGLRRPCWDTLPPTPPATDRARPPPSPRLPPLPPQAS